MILEVPEDMGLGIGLPWQVLADAHLRASVSLFINWAVWKIAQGYPRKKYSGVPGPQY